MLRHINPRRILCAKVRVNSALFSSRTVTGYHDFHVKSRTFMCFFKPFSMTVSCPVPFPVLPEFRILFPVRIRTELLLFRQTAKRNVFVCRDGWYKLSCFPDKQKKNSFRQKPCHHQFSVFIPLRQPAVIGTAVFILYGSNCIKE